MAKDLDAGDLNPYEEFVKAADERLMLTATRSIFDEFQTIRRLRRQERISKHLDDAEATEAEEGAEDQLDLDTDEAFIAEAEADKGGQEDDEFLRLAKGLERIRSTLGKAFFHRISMVSGDVNFIDAAQAGSDAVGDGVAYQVDPGEALLQARDVAEPFYRARSLAAVIQPLMTVGRIEDACKAALESLAAARACQTDDLVAAYACAIPALITTEQTGEAADALEIALNRSHGIGDLERRSSALMRLCSTLMEAGALPPAVKRSLSRSIIGDDINFWGKPVIKSPLVEVILSLSGVDDDTLIFLQKVVVHPDDSIRRSVLRTLPLERMSIFGICSSVT